MIIDWKVVGGIGVIIAIMLIILMLFAPGCKSWGLFPLNEVDTAPDTPKERFEKAVKSVNWLIILSIIGMAVCGAAMINGSRWALGPLIGSGASLCLSLVVSRYAEILALITLLCMIGGIGFFIYTVVVKKKALKEIVTTVEKIKPHLSERGIKEFFNNKNNPDSAPSVQSATTEKIVAKIKEKFPEKENKGE